MILGSGLLQSSGWTPTWLIRDEFTDTLAAGSVNGTAATPGPGTRTVTDAESKVSVGSGGLALAGGKASPAGGDPGLWYAAQARAAGLAQITKMSISSGIIYAGWDNNQSSIAQFGFNAINGSLYTNLDTSGTAVIHATMSGSDYTHVTIARSVGYFSLIKGDGISSWTLMWAGSTHTTATIYPGVQNFSAVANVDYLRVAQLPAPFDSDDGLTTDTHSGSVAAGTTFVHEADMLLEFTVTTLASSDGIYIHFRSEDETVGTRNFWRIYITTTGLLALYEAVEDVFTVRGSVAGAVSNGHRVVVTADGSTLKIYSNNTLRIAYASATNFATATAGNLLSLGGGVVSDLKSWPRTLSGAAASILNKASA